MEIGFIGVGIMGRPMILNLIKGGHRLHVWSRRAESMTPVLDAGAHGYDSAAAVAAASDIVISIVADAPDVEQVALGAHGVVHGARKGLIFIDMSTIAPTAAKNIAARLAEHGVTMLDAPVSGGETGAINGTLTIMVGGDAIAFEKALPAFLCMGKTVTLIGDSGAGQVTKACNQILTGVGVAMVAEALNFARASGVDPVKVRQAMLGGSAYSRVLENHGQRMLDRNFKPGFKAWMHRKDMKIVLDEAHRMGVATPTTAITAQLFNALIGAGEGEKDSLSLIALLERMSEAPSSHE
ncbi:MAG TPA: NAD(P)-dependent oxidoreductase [Rhodocyclaceae bacterium]|nr:NAD(P)-dependent oxidoreductase [Rhodocyclaceae bacterium]